MNGDSESNEGQTRIAEVLLPVAVDNAYSYLVPPGLRLSPGDCVKVPLGARDALGIVWSIGPFGLAPEGARSNLKTIVSKYDRPPLNDRLRAFIDGWRAGPWRRAAWPCGSRPALSRTQGRRRSESATGSPARRQSA
jgi:hypothetical protein